MYDNEYQLRTDRYLALLQRHERKLFWYVMRRSHLHDDRLLDLLQDIRERLWRSFDSLRPDATSGEEYAWMKWHALSVIEHRFRRKRFSTVSVESLDGLPADDSNREMFLLLNEAMSHLPDDDRALLQALCDGVTPEEIAAEQHRSLHTVENQISMARQRLRTICTQLKILDP